TITNILLPTPTTPPHPPSFPTRRSSDLSALRRSPKRQRRKRLAAGFGHQHIAFNPHAANAAQIDSRLDCDDHARRKRVLGLFSRSEEHTSELQSLRHFVCRLLLEKKKIG